MWLARLASLVIGYALGLIQTGYLYSRSVGIDIREHGSGNSGTTNTLRVLGLKAGAVTFAGDLLKAVAAVWIPYLLFGKTYPEAVRLLQLYGGFGSVMGHNFPYYLNFKGGKGIACTAGMIISLIPLAAPICLALFIGSVVFTGYVSLGSILVVLAFLIQVILFNMKGMIGLDPAFIMEFNILAACFTAMGIWRHRSNIVRLLSGTENKFNILKKKEK